MNFSFLKDNAIPLFYMYSNLICSFVIFVTFICFIKNKNLTRREKVFSYILITHVFYFLLDTCWAALYYNLTNIDDVALRFIRIFKYSLVTVASYLWFMYISIYVRAHYMDDKKN